MPGNLERCDGVNACIRVGTTPQTRIHFESDDALKIDDLRKAIKSAMPNKFMASDSNDIVVRDPKTKKKIDSIQTLALPNGIEPGTEENPYNVDDPRRGGFLLI